MVKKTHLRKLSTGIREKDEADLETANRTIEPYAALYMIHFANRESMLPHWRPVIDNTLLK